MNYLFIRFQKKGEKVRLELHYLSHDATDLHCPYPSRCVFTSLFLSRALCPSLLRRKP